MLAFAYAECGLNVDDFFGLSWYEWSLEVHKVKQKRVLENKIWEGHAVLTRELMAAVINSAGKSFKRTFEAKELMPLSFDKVEVQEDNRTDEEILAIFPKKFKDVKK